jgi:hypothetical protein
MIPYIRDQGSWTAFCFGWRFADTALSCASDLVSYIFATWCITNYFSFPLTSIHLATKPTTHSFIRLIFILPILIAAPQLPYPFGREAFPLHASITEKDEMGHFGFMSMI